MHHAAREILYVAVDLTNEDRLQYEHNVVDKSNGVNLCFVHEDLRDPLYHDLEHSIHVYNDLAKILCPL